MAYSSTKPANGTSLVSADMRENFRALKEDAIVVALSVPDASITQAKLKTSSGSVSQVDVGSSLLTLPGGEYGFYPQIKTSSVSDVYRGASILFFGTVAGFTSYVTKISLYSESDTIYAQQRYVTSSGEVFWIFILRVIVDYTETGVGGELIEHKAGDIISMYQAPDHPCFGNGGKPLLVSHPFGSYDPDKHEIIVINPTKEEVTEMKGRCEKGEDEPDKDLLEIITEEYVIDENSAPKWPTKEVTVGLPKDRDWKRDPDDTKVTPIKKVIPQPKGVLVKKLRRQP